MVKSSTVLSQYLPLWSFLKFAVLVQCALYFVNQSTMRSRCYSQKSCNNAKAWKLLPAWCAWCAWQVNKSVKYIETIAHKMIIETQQVDGRTFEFGHGAQSLFLLFIWFAKLTQEEDRDQYNKQMTVAFCNRYSNSSLLWQILVLCLFLLTGSHSDLCLQGACSQMWCTTSVKWKVDNVVVRI